MSGSDTSSGGSVGLLRRAKPAVAVNRERPSLAGDSEVLPPLGDDGSWLVTRGPSKLFHVSESFARACHLMDGSRTVDEIVAELGGPWDRDRLASVVDQLDTNAILEDGKTRDRQRRWNFAPPAALQFTLLNPTRALRRLTPIIKKVVRLESAVICIALALAGAVALMSQWGSVTTVLSEPQSIWMYLAVLGAFLFATAVHEIAHSAVLIAHGGEPKRIGFMLFYFMPAFFADVSDGWRLPRPAQRAQVAFAGIVAQSALSGLAGLATLLVSEGLLESTLVVFAVSTYASGLLNLIPFVKLDGYIALMSLTGVSHLRDNAMSDARARIGVALFGGGFEPKLPHLKWASIYGLACIAFPLVLIVQALRLWSEYIVLLGSTAAFLRWALAAFVGWFIVNRLRRFIVQARGNGASLTRLAVVSAALVAGAVVAATTAQVPIRYDAGFFTEVESGTVVVVLPSAGTADYLEEGDIITFKSAGPVLQPIRGSGRVATVTAEMRVGPLAATTPTTASLPQPFPNTIEAELIEGDVPDSGIASIDGGEVSPWVWLRRSFLS